MEWYQKEVSQVLEELKTSRSGLSGPEASKRLSEYGPNRLAGAKRESRAKKLIKQFTEFIILVLIGAAIIAGLLGEWIDTLAILAIVVLNGVIGFIQEQKAEEVMEALKKLAAPNAKVIRDGKLSTIPASELVPGDVVSLESGDYVPADCRVIESNFLKVQEAPLTGESNPIDKQADYLENTVPLADRINMLYLGTTAVYGRGLGVVAATGMSTEMGQIAKMLQEVKPEPTPLQKRLAEFGRSLVYAAGAICALIFLLGIFRGEDMLDMFLIAVSLAVAAIPEGLPAVVTIVLALGVQRMVKRHALIRKLPSVETLGSATIIASDKTGTLTQNQMTVKKLFLANGEALSISGTGYSPSGKFFKGPHETDPAKDALLMLAVKTGLLCNTAELKENEGGQWQVIGDPTEGSLLTLAAKAGLDKKSFEKEYEFMGEIPFDAERKMMTTLFKDKGGTYHVFIKGAIERVLPLCKSVNDSSGIRDMTDADRKRITDAADTFSEEAMRVLGLAYRRSEEPLTIHSAHKLETDLAFAGIVGMIDPPREEVFAAVQKARSAGITPIMITGDHKKTAVAIGREIGLFDDEDEAVTGEELDRMGEEEFQRRLKRIKIYARVSPQHKMKIVQAWKRRGDIIAMTGDGVNDAPALKEADIGVAMGITGTDVTKEAADMVLTDDNFASIVSAVEEGRGIFNNIRRVVHFLISCNVGEIFVLLIASLTGMPLPLLPVQILWTNLVTDGLPALGLAMERVEPDIMDRAPRRKEEGIVTGTLLALMLIQGVFMAVVTLGVYTLELYWYESSLIKAQTMAFTVLVFCQKFHVYNCRSLWGSVFKLGFFTNKMLNIAVVIIITTQVLLIYIPGLEEIFKVVPLSIADWGIVIGASVQPLVWMEIVKYFKKGRAKAK